MDPISINDCLVSLKGIRGQVYDQLDAGTRVELDNVIVRLETALTEAKTTLRSEDVERALALVAKVIETISNVTKLISLFCE